MIKIHVYVCTSIALPTSMAQPCACLTGDPEVTGFIPTGSGNDLSGILIMKYFPSTDFFHPHLVSNILSWRACPVKVWSGKLTTLDMTHLIDWAIKPQHKQTNQEWHLSVSGKRMCTSTDKQLRELNLSRNSMVR